MPSPFFPRHFRGGFSLLAVAVVLTGVLVGFRLQSKLSTQSQRPGQSHPTGRADSGSSSQAALTESSSATVMPRAADRPVAAPPGPAQPAPEAVTRAFPSITEVTPDWRDFRPESVTVSPYPDLPVRFTRTALRDEGRYVTWIGRNPDLPGASFVGVATAKGYDAILVMPGSSQFSYHVRGTEVVVAETFPGEETCGDAPVHLKPVVPTEPTGVNYEISYAPGHQPLPDTFADTAPLKVDVLFAYDADTLAAATAKSSDPVGYIDGQMKAILETSNLALSQSLVTTFAWRYLGIVPAQSYPRTGKSLDDINAMQSGGAIGDWVRNMHYQRGADQIALLVGGEMDFAGRGSSATQKAVAPALANCVVHWGSSYQTLAHELSHNFGCQHDRAHVTVINLGEYGPPPPDGDGLWCYGYMWTNPPVPPGYTGSTGTSGDLMSYADWRVPYFSNPNISVHVFSSMFGWQVNLDLGVQRLGLPETDPKAAYNARVLNDQALAMSNLSEEIALPAITQQPANTSTERGAYVNLSVKATGGGLAYQWLKGGVVISGAITPTYSKFAEDADAGSYTVTVTNLVGTVTSNAATVTITVPPPPPASSGGGGGGGGGVPSSWFLGMLGVAGLARWAGRRRS